jgi:hypothetical protein
LVAQFVCGCGLDVSGLQDLGGGDDAGADSGVHPRGDATTFDTGVGVGADTGGGGTSDSGGGDDVGSSDDSTGGDDSAGGDDSSDTGVASFDAPPVDGCTPKGPEQCTNGVDDDCNGMTDCADPACAQQQYTCVSAPPGGWAFVAFDPSAQLGCPSALHATSVDVDPIENQAQCSCSCAVGTPPTCSGNVSTSYGNSGTCPTMGGQFPADGSCAKTPVTVMPYAQVGNPAGSGGTCTAMSMPMVPPAGSSKGQICGGQNKFGAGCPSGKVCALVPDSFSQCIAKGGQVACPGGDYGNLHFVGNLKDTRGCSACKCGGTPQCALTWNFFSNPACNGTAQFTLHPDGNCQATGGTTMYSSSSLTGDATNATCGAPTMEPSPTGQITLDAEQTVCCQ